MMAIVVGRVTDRGTTASLSCMPRSQLRGRRSARYSWKLSDGANPSLLRLRNSSKTCDLWHLQPPDYDSWVRCKKRPRGNLWRISPCCTCCCQVPHVHIILAKQQAVFLTAIMVLFCGHMTRLLRVCIVHTGAACTRDPGNAAGVYAAGRRQRGSLPAAAVPGALCHDTAVCENCKLKKNRMHLCCCNGTLTAQTLPRIGFMHSRQGAGAAVQINAVFQDQVVNQFFFVTDRAVDTATQVPELRAAAIQLLAAPLGGDALAAEYLLLQLLSRQAFVSPRTDCLSPY